MDIPLPANVLHCTQCGGELHPDEGQIFLVCPYCHAAVFVDKSQVVFHWYLSPTLDESRARASLARWMAGNQTVKDLDKKANVVGSTFEYFPLWYFKLKRPDDREEIVLEPAAATSISELRRLNLPAGDLSKFNETISPYSHAPTVPLQTALDWLRDRQVNVDFIVERALVHIPLYTFKYVYRDATYTAVVEAGTGQVLANIFPAKAEAPYMLIGGITAFVYLCLALAPLTGAFTGSESGTLAGLGICMGAGLLAAPILFAFAAWVAAKV